MYVSEKTAVKLLNAGYVVGVMTDTVYGLASLAEYSHKIYQLKGRSKKKKLINMIGDISQVMPVDKTVYRQMLLSWPGQVTYIVEQDRQLTSYRISANQTVLSLCQGVKKPLKTTSANRSGSLPVTTDDEFFKQFPTVALVKPVIPESKSNTASKILLYNKGKFIKIR